MRPSLLCGLLFGAAACVAALPAAEEADTLPAGAKKTETKMDDWILVRMTGTVATGVVAIGGETTGTTIKANKVTWELDFGGDANLQKKAEKLNGRKVLVKGTLERREGVEVKERWIVHVEKLKPAK